METHVASTLTFGGVDFKGEKDIKHIEYRNNLVKKYHPDFELPNGILIECKGWFKTADRTKHLCVKAQHPDKDIRFVFSNPHAKIGKGSKTTYAMWCEKYGFKFATGFVPQAWIDEPKKKSKPTDAEIYEAKWDAFHGKGCDHSLAACATYKEDYDNLVYVCRTCNKTIA